MRVWQKTYLYTLLLFLLVFYGGLFALGRIWLHGALKSARSACDNEGYAIASAFENAFSRVRPEERVLVARRFGGNYAKRGITFALFQDGLPIYGNLPDGYLRYDAEEAYRMRLVRPGGGVALRLVERLADGEVLVLHKDVTGVFSDFRRLACMLVGIGLAVSLLMTVGLFYTMWRVNKPVDNLAHELRTPLTAIRGYAEYLQAANASREERYSATQYIIDESARLADITEKLLIMANLREGEIDRARVELAALAEQAAMLYPTLRTECTPCVVMGDRALLQSLVNNLVGNAVRASGEDTPVLLRVGAQGFSVEDAGCGMSAQQLLHANRPNQPAPRIAGGNGLGIPLCHKIAQLHGATLRFSENAAGGVTASVVFTKP